MISKKSKLLPTPSFGTGLPSRSLRRSSLDLRGLLVLPLGIAMVSGIEPLPNELNTADAGTAVEGLIADSELEEPAAALESELLPPLSEPPLALNGGVGVLPGLGAPVGEADAFAVPLFDDVLEEERSLAGGPSERGFFSAPRDEGIRRQELLLGGFSDSLTREGFRFGLRTSANFDSNPYLVETGEESEYSFTLIPTVEYRSGPLTDVPGVVTFTYSPFVRWYFNDSDLNTVDHSAAGSVSYDGVRGSVGLTAEYARFSESNRFVGDLVTTDFFSFGATGSYAVTDNSDLEVSWSYDLRDFDDPTRFDTEVGNLQLSWLRRMRNREYLEMGPRVKYSVSDSDSLGEVETFAYLWALRYQPPALNGNLEVEMDLGLESVEREGRGGSNTDFAGSLDLSYELSDRFRTELALSYGAVSQTSVQSFGEGGGGGQEFTGRLRGVYSPNELWQTLGGVSFLSEASPSDVGETIDTLTWDLALRRSLGRNAVTAGGSVGLSEYSNVGGAATKSDGSYYVGYLSFAHFWNRTTFDSTLRWSSNTGDRDWERLQLMTGLSFQF